MENLINKLSFEEEDKKAILSIYEKIINSEFKNEFEDGVNSSINDPEFDVSVSAEDLSKKINVHVYSLYLVHFLACALKLKAEYAKQRISDKIYYDTMNDLTYKVTQCKTMYGVCGISAYKWYKRIFGMKIFMLGRLQFEITEFPDPGYKDYIKKGDRAYSLHIPAAGPLTYDMVQDSLKQAYEFFKCEKYLIVFCNSWLLYPPYYRDAFVEGSNMRMFYEQFDIMKETEYPTKASVNNWVFGRPGDEIDYDQVPSHTRLQKNFINYFKNGKPAGLGFGMIIFDGEKIVNKPIA